MKSPDTHANYSPSMLKNSARLHVLVVEDELLIRWSIAETLGRAGHIVVEAADAASAMRALAEAGKPFDVVLLDFRLPDSNDLTLFSHVRSTMPSSPVVLMTAYGTPEMTRRALELGAYRVLSKPIDMADLEPLVQEAHRLGRPA